MIGDQGSILKCQKSLKANFGTFWCFNTKSYLWMEIENVPLWNFNASSWHLNASIWHLTPALGVYEIDLQD